MGQQQDEKPGQAWSAKMKGEVKLGRDLIQPTLPLVLTHVQLLAQRPQSLQHSQL